MKLKTFGALVQVPTSWPATTAANGNRQRLVIVSTTSRVRALDLFTRNGIRHLTLSHLSKYGYSDMGGLAAEVATAHPGEVFWQPKDGLGDYIPVPNQR